MTRTEELVKKANVLCNDPKNDCKSTEDLCFMMGKWADENPSEANIAMYLGKKGWPLSTYGIPTYEEAAKTLDEYYEYKKNQWLDKACKWLKENIENYYYLDEAYDQVISIKRILEDFPKAMEE